MSDPLDVDNFLFQMLYDSNDIILQSNVLKSLQSRTKRFGYSININYFNKYITSSLEKKFKYEATIAVLNESYDPTNEDKTYEKRHYSLLINELNYRSKLLIENIFKAFRIAYPDNPVKKFYFNTYYYDLLSSDRVRKDNATSVLEQILPKKLYLLLFDLFAIEDFANPNRERDFKEAAQEKFGFDLNEKNLLDYLYTENDYWLKLILDYGNNEVGEDMLNKMDRVNFLNKTEVFKEVPNEILFQLADKAKEKEYLNGKDIITQGKVVDSLFVIYKGTIDILIGNDGKSVAEFGPKEVLGEIELFRAAENQFAVATARAKGEVICIILKKNDFDEVLDTNIDLARALIRSLGERLEKMNMRIKEIEAKE